MCQDAKDTPCNHYGDYEYINCNYLPSVRAVWGDNQCFYEPVFCSTPPIVENATHNGYRYVHSSLHEKVEYSCDEGFEMEGNKIVTCNYNGRWSAPPRCSPKIIVNSTLSPTIESGIGSRPGRSRSSLHDLLSIVLPLLLILLAITLVVLVVRYQRKIRTRRKRDLTMEYVQFEIALIQRNAIDEPPLPLRRKHDSLGTAYSVSTPKRIRPFDATVFYHFDTGDDFVLNQLLPELEESRDFNLCIHSRNFVPGRDIKDNIEEAIEASNSAIIVMSQGFVDSMWCKEEFTHCYIENMKDAAFNLFVIMMQPEDTLVNISPYMKTFFANKTYLQVNDPELFEKLATHLEDARQSEDDDVNDNNENIDDFCSVDDDDDDDDDDDE